MEIWKPIPGYQGLYEASTLGRIRSVDRPTPHPRNSNMPLIRKGRILKSELDKYGYPVVTLSKEGKTRTHKVHRLIAETYIPNPDNLPQIDHRNSVKYDNQPKNLRWCTMQENNAWRDEKNRPNVLCKDTGQTFSSSYDAAAWVIQNRCRNKKGFLTTNHKTVARSIRDNCLGRIKVAYSFHWVYLEGSTTIPKGSREKSRNGEPRDRRVKI